MTIMDSLGNALDRTENLLLQSLSRNERRQLVPQVESITVEPHAVIMDVDQKIEALYFPEDVLVRVRSSRQHASADTGMIGREGMFGWSGLLGCERSVNRVVADARGGKMMRLDLVALDRGLAFSASFRATLLRFVQIILLQLAKQAETPAAGSIDRRLACWLLMRHDRSPGDELRLQHVEIAASVGSRRASVTDAFHRLEGEHVIRCRRGKLLIRDRAALERLAGESYGHPELLYRQLIGPFGKTAREMPAVRPHLNVSSALNSIVSTSRQAAGFEHAI